jgi:AbiU2
MMNNNPLFWITIHHAMLLSAFVVLGRIFDQQSKHNLDALMSAVSKDLQAFSIIALEARKRSCGLTPQQATGYVVDAHVLTAADVRSLRKQVDRWRRVYKQVYRDVRDKVFAHNELSELADKNAVLARVNVEEMKDLFKFLGALYSTLWNTFHNGIAPDLRTYDAQFAPGEKVYREGKMALTAMSRASASLEGVGA